VDDGVRHGERKPTPAGGSRPTDGIARRMGDLIDIGGGIRLACDDVGSGRPVL
jgi:hypothetical protein